MNPSIEAANAMLAASPDRSQYLTFMLGGETFAIGILAIKEIIEYGDLTVVPLMPDSVRGVINLRGAVLPVIDLSMRLGRRTTELGKRTCIVVVETGSGETGRDVGVIVDAVNEVLDIPGNQVEPPPAFGARLRADLIEGMGKVNDSFVILLDVNHVLSAEDTSALPAASLPAVPEMAAAA
jgi:purine-binding chemotaxis protein CheW